jgi:hypothetical protein
MVPDARQRVLLLLSLVVLLSSCRESTTGEAPVLARDGLRRELIGCLALFSEDGRAIDSTYYNSSPRVQLDSIIVGITARDSVPGVVWLLHRLDSAGRRLDDRSSGWQVGPVWWADSLTDTVRLSFTTGFSGASFVLSAPVGGPDSLHGRAEDHWDFGPPFTNSRGGAFARHVPCR